MQQLRLGTRSSWHQSSNKETSSISLAHITGFTLNWHLGIALFRDARSVRELSAQLPPTQKPVPCPAQSPASPPSRGRLFVQPIMQLVANV